MQPENNPIPFGPYTLMRRIGAGGMGEVYLARENGPHRRAVVVKKVLPDFVKNKSFVGRFLDESKVVVRLRHANIARVYDMGEVDGEYFLAMEYVQGKTVSRFTRRMREYKKPFPLGLILLIGERICEGLAYAHDAVDEHGEPLHLVHRDLSPANVCISYQGEVKIIDFGAAQSTLKNEQTAPRVVIGNLTYMSPEQARKQAVDGRADVYSAGVVLWELLSSTLLPQKGDPVERWRKAANPIWEPPSMLNPKVPKEVDRVILKALAKDRELRWQDANHFGQQLRRLRETLTPDMTDEELGIQLALVFQAEKEMEDNALKQTLEGTFESTSEAATVLVPPNSLAFEHTMIEAPMVSLQNEVTATEVVANSRDAIPTSRIGFGVTLNKPNDASGRSMLQEIEAIDTGIAATAISEVSEIVVVSQTPPRTSARQTESIPAQSPRLLRKFAQQRRQWLLVGVGLFIVASMLGFVFAWWLSE